MSILDKPADLFKSQSIAPEKENLEKILDAILKRDGIEIPWGLKRQCKQMVVE